MVIGELDKIYRDHVKILGAGSSALIENLADDSASPTPTPEPKKRFKLGSIVYVILLLIIIGGVRKMLGTESEGEFIGPELDWMDQYPHDKTYPPVNLLTGTRNERIRRTLYMSNSALKNTRPLVVQGGEVHEGGSVTDTYDAGVLNDERSVIGNGGVFSSTADYTLYFDGDTNRESDLVMFAIREWVEYTMQAVDPIYRLSVSGNMTIVVGPKNPNMAPDVDGRLSFVSNTIWIRYHQPTASTKAQMIRTFIHEYAHLIHTKNGDVASDCPTGICKNMRGVTERSRDVMRWKDKVDTVLSLGIELPDLSYEEAVALNKDILDLRLRQIYEKSLTNPLYYDLRKVGAYTLTDHYEFWAEACQSYLLLNGDPEIFPRTHEIRAEDPKLFALLEEVDK